MINIVKVDQWTNERWREQGDQSGMRAGASAYLHTDPTVCSPGSTKPQPTGCCVREHLMHHSSCTRSTALRSPLTTVAFTGGRDILTRSQSITQGHVEWPSSGARRAEPLLPTLLHKGADDGPDVPFPAGSWRKREQSRQLSCRSATEHPGTIRCQRRQQIHRLAPCHRETP